MSGIFLEFSKQKNKITPDHSRAEYKNIFLRTYQFFVGFARK